MDESNLFVSCAANIFSLFLTKWFLLNHISITVGDGRKGYPDEAPYNAIHVGAAAPSLPQAVSYHTISSQKFICLLKHDFLNQIFVSY